LNIEGEEPPAEEPPAEEGEESKKVEQLSDLSEEEEIKVPPKDLTGIVFSSSDIIIELDRLVYVVYAIENDC